MSRNFSRMSMPYGNYETNNISREDLLSALLDLTEFDEPEYESSRAFTPREVIFHKPATVVLWEDGSKTVVVCGKYDVYDREKGLALCYMKKALGNTGAYNNILKEALDYED